MTVLKDTIRAAASREALCEALQAGAAFEQLSVGDIGAAARRLRQLPGAPDIRIAYLANHTVEPLPDYVGVCNLYAGIADEAFVAPFGQHFQAVLDPASPLAAFAPGLVILSLSLRDLAPQVVTDFAGLSPAALEAERARIVQQVGDWVEAAKRTTKAHLLVCNFAMPTRWQAGIADQKSTAGEQAFYLRLNLDLLERLRPEPRVHVLDVDRVLAGHGRERAFSAKLYYLARMEWHESVLPRLAEEIRRYVRVLLNRTRKCLVLDLDNTLWGGVVGEDGVDGLKVGPGGPVDEAYLAFQQYIRALKNRGVILAVASKNNPDDAIEVFKTRPEMALSLDDFAAMEINWNSKHESLARISERLNIGIDSLVFADDNPAECALIREMLPEVEVVHLAGDPAGFVERLQRTAAFERLQITDEDRRKTEAYLENHRRDSLHQSVGSMADFLKALETRITVRRPRERDTARVHQLFVKTNQFNVTTRRYTPADVAGFMQNNGYDLRIIDVADRFGDLGTVGLVLVDRKEPEPSIDSFVMSCRAMGREVETAIMNELKRDYLLSGQYASLAAHYLPTKKNKPVERFFDAQGFSVVEEVEGGARTYRLTAEQAAAIDCDHITLVNEAG